MYVIFTIHAHAPKLNNEEFEIFMTFTFRHCHAGKRKTIKSMYMFDRAGLRVCMRWGYMMMCFVSFANTNATHVRKANTQVRAPQCASAADAAEAAPSARILLLAPYGARKLRQTGDNESTRHTAG